MAHLGNVGEDNCGRDEDNGLLVDDIELLGDGGGGKTNTGEGSAGLGDNAGRRGKLLDELIGAVGGVGLRAHRAAGYMR